MKKIAVIITDAFSYAGTENICNFMTECLAEEGIITVLSMRGSGDTFYPYSRINELISFQNEKKPFKALRNHVIKNKYDTVFVVSMGKLSFLVMLFFYFSCKSKGKTKFISCEHVSFDSFSWIVKSLKLISLKWYERVVVLTEKDRLKFSSYGINAIKINNPINYHYYVKEKRTYTALAVGRLNNQKGFDRLLDIWSEFYKKNKNWVLFIAGDGELSDFLKDKAVTLGIDKSVSFLGRVDDLSNLYKECDMYLMTSRYEGLPMVLLEAKSWSLPIIAFDCPTGPREIINDGVDGFLIENGNSNQFLSKMEELASSDDLLFNLSMATLNTFHQFDANTVKEEWQRLV